MREFLNKRFKTIHDLSKISQISQRMLRKLPSLHISNLTEPHSDVGSSLSWVINCHLILSATYPISRPVCGAILSSTAAKNLIIPNIPRDLFCSDGQPQWNVVLAIKLVAIMLISEWVW